MKLGFSTRDYLMYSESPFALGGAVLFWNRNLSDPDVASRYLENLSLPEFDMCSAYHFALGCYRASWDHVKYVKSFRPSENESFFFLRPSFNPV